MFWVLLGSIHGRLHRPGPFRRCASRMDCLSPEMIWLQLNRDEDGSSRDRLMRHAHEVATSDEYTEFRIWTGSTARRLRRPTHLAHDAVYRAGKAWRGFRESLPAPAVARWH